MAAQPPPEAYFVNLVIGADDTVGLFLALFIFYGDPCTKEDFLLVVGGAVHHF